MGYCLSFSIGLNGLLLLGLNFLWVFLVSRFHVTDPKILGLRLGCCCVCFTIKLL